MTPPKYLKNAGKGTVDEVFRRIEQLERETTQLRAQKVPTVQRLDILDTAAIGNVPDPIENQIAIDSADEQHAWYSNGEWRKCGFIHYMRMWQFETVTTLNGITPGDPQQLSFDRWDYSNASKIEPLAVVGDAVFFAKCHQRGLYAISASVKFDQQINVAPEGVGIAIMERNGSTYAAAATVVHPGQPIGGLGTTGDYSMTLVRSYPPIWVADTTDTLAPAEPEFGMSVSVISADATTDTFNAMMEVHLLHSYDYEVIPAAGGGS